MIFFVALGGVFVGIGMAIIGTSEDIVIKVFGGFLNLSGALIWCAVSYRSGMLTAEEGKIQNLNNAVPRCEPMSPIPEIVGKADKAKPKCSRRTSPHPNRLKRPWD